MDEDVSRPLLEHVLAPVANEDDARRTATALEAFAPERVTAVFVVEKAGGAPDTISPAQASELAERSFEAFRAIRTDAETRLVSGTDVTETIFALADEAEASSIVFVSRGGGRLIQLLSGDTALQLVTRNEIPVIALPRIADDG